MTTIDRILELIDRQYDNYAQFERALKLSAQTVNDWKRGKSQAYLKRIPELAAHFGVTSAYLLCETDDPGATTQNNPTSGVPVIGRIKAGIPVWSGDIFTEEYIDIADVDADAAMQVSGDSMVYAGIFEGDYVLLQKADRAHQGQIVAAVADDGFGYAELTLKYYAQDRVKGPVLRAANPAYKDIPMGNKYKVIGVFAGLVRYDEPSLREISEIELTRADLSQEWTSLVEDAINAGLDTEDIRDMIRMLKKARR